MHTERDTREAYLAQRALEERQSVVFAPRLAVYREHPALPLWRRAVMFDRACAAGVVFW